MEKKNVEYIVCAVRGGPESRETVSRAIDLALEKNAWLTFLHITDIEFLNHATIGPPSVVFRELSEMGKFTMMILIDRAKRRGIEKVDYLIREGNVCKQLLQFAKETNADVLVIGKPVRSPGTNVFRKKSYGELLKRLAEETDLEVISVTPSIRGENDD